MKDLLGIQALKNDQFERYVYCITESAFGGFGTFMALAMFYVYVLHWTTSTAFTILIGLSLAKTIISATTLYQLTKK